MDYCSYFIDDKALFGSYPTNERIKELKGIGVNHFIDLISPGDVPSPYDSETLDNYISYPIKDINTPENYIDFSKLIVKICNIIKNLKKGEKVYVHCKGGHGRSGIAVACILCQLYRISPDASIELTTKYHNSRTVMKDIWRKMGSPQTGRQKLFVMRLFKPLYFFKAYTTGISCGFSNFSLHPVMIINLGTFPTSEAAIQAFKNIDNKDYVRKQLESLSPLKSRILGENLQIRDKNWDIKKNNIMYNIVKLKFKQNEEIKENLMKSGLRPIYHRFKEDGDNVLGKILMRIREELINDEI